MTSRRTSRARNYLQPDFNAQGPHTVFRLNKDRGKVTHYATYTSQSNSNNPAPWELVKRYDGQGSSHYNKVTGEFLATPHVHDPHTTGGVRKARPDEIPK